MALLRCLSPFARAKGSCSVNDTKHPFVENLLHSWSFRVKYLNGTLSGPASQQLFVHCSSGVSRHDGAEAGDMEGLSGC